MKVILSLITNEGSIAQRLVELENRPFKDEHIIILHADGEMNLLVGMVEHIPLRGASPSVCMNDMSRMLLHVQDLSSVHGSLKTPTYYEKRGWYIRPANECA
jgi:hypothetical protein